MKAFSVSRRKNSILTRRILVFTFIVLIFGMFFTKGSIISPIIVNASTTSWSSAGSFGSDAVHDLGSRNTGTVRINYDVTPAYNNIDGFVGYADSSTAITTWSSMSIQVRMNPSGYFDVRNGNSYTSDTGVAYSANNTYHVEIVADLQSGSYDVWVTPPSSSPILIADDFVFRSDAPAIDDVGTVCLKSTADNDFYVEDHTPAVIARVNSGGSDASPYSADTCFSGGSTYSTANTINTSNATDPAPMTVYQTERYGEFSYSFAGLIPQEPYMVRLHFAESYFSTVNARKFNIDINNARVLTDYDIYADAGSNNAVIKEFTTAANSSGQIVVDFLNGSMQNPLSRGIEIIALQLTESAPTPVSVAETWNPSADAYVKDGADADNNFGTANQLYVKSDGTGYNRKVYAKFNFSSISGNSVTSSVLRVKVQSVGSDASRTIKLYGTGNDSWGEETITWNNAPAGSTYIGSQDVSNTVGEWYEFDVTSYAVSNMSDKIVSFLLINEGVPASQGYVIFHSKEATNLTDRPELVIESVLEPEPTPTLTPTPSTIPTSTPTSTPVPTLTPTPTVIPGAFDMEFTTPSSNYSASCRRSFGAGLYDPVTNKTFICWNGAGMDVMVQEFNHSIGVWSSPVMVRDNNYTGYWDYHNYPTMVMGPDGKLVVYFCTHSSSIYQVKAPNTHSISGTWTTTQISTDKNAYPMPAVVDDDIYIFYSCNDDINWPYRSYRYIKSSDNGSTWTSPVTVIDSQKLDPQKFDEVYAWGVVNDPDDSRIGITWCMAGGTEHNAASKNLYFAYFDTTNSIMRNAAGTSLGSEILYNELPNCLVYSKTGDPEATAWSARHPFNNPQPAFSDTTGYPIVSYGVTDGTSRIEFAKWNGSSWVKTTAVSGNSAHNDLEALGGDNYRILYKINNETVGVHRTSDEGSTWTLDASGAIPYTGSDTGTYEIQFLYNNVPEAIGFIGMKNSAYDYTGINHFTIIKDGNGQIPTPVPGAVTETWNPSADAFVRDGADADNNFGTANQLYVKSDGTGYNRKSYAKFNFISISGDSVTTAVLRVKVQSVGSDASRTIKLYGTDNESWGEETITWNNAPEGSTYIGSQDISNTVGEWYEFDVTSYVGSNMSDKVVSFLLINEGVPASNGYVMFHSKEAAASADRPQLVIESIED